MDIQSDDNQLELLATQPRITSADEEGDLCPECGQPLWYWKKAVKNVTLAVPVNADMIG